MPFGLGFGETILIFAVVLLFFGPRKLPEFASGLGKGIRDFRRAMNGITEELRNDPMDTPEAQRAAFPASAPFPASVPLASEAVPASGAPTSLAAEPVPAAAESVPAAEPARPALA